MKMASYRYKIRGRKGGKGRFRGGIREDAYSHTGGIFIRDTARDTAYSL